MYVLGIDTATLVCSAAVVSREQTLAEYNLQVKKTHSERLLPLIDTMLRNAGLTLNDLSGIAIAAGPGSFTGLRIGMVTAKALGQALDLPLVGIATLEALAAQHPHFQGVISPILDARRQQVYQALFAPGQRPTYLIKERVLSVSTLLDELAERQEQVLFVGDGVPVHRQIIEEKLGSRSCFMPPDGGICRAATVARLGLQELTAGRGQSWRHLEPFYVRRSEADVKYDQRVCEGGKS